jgi:hypothetical protein
MSIYIIHDTTLYVNTLSGEMPTSVGVSFMLLDCEARRRHILSIKHISLSFFSDKLEERVTGKLLIYAFELLGNLTKITKN